MTYNPVIADIEEIRQSWGWLLGLGILLIILGVACIAFDVTATFATMLVFGWLLFLSGLFTLVQALFSGTWSGFSLYLLSALIRGFTGYMLIRYPAMGAEALTLVLASFFIVAGLFRAIGFGMARFPSWGWFVFSGVISVGLGIALLVQMPASSVWFIGFAIGVDLVLDGAAIASFATAIHRGFEGRRALRAA